MMVRIVSAVTLALLLLCPGWQPSAQGGVENPHDMVQKYLDSLGAVGYTMDPIHETYVTATFPGCTFFSVWFQQYPLGVEPPEGLAESNVFMVHGNRVVAMTSPDDLKRLFLNWLPPLAIPDPASLPPVTIVDPNSTPAANMARTWLRLSEEFIQDGFYGFKEPRIVESSATTVMGQVVIDEGGQGFIRVYLDFDDKGNLSDVIEVSYIIIGIRPL